MSIWALWIFLVRLHNVYSSDIVQVWQPVVVSNATIYNSTLQTMQVNVASDIPCSIIASRQPWAHLFCFLEGVCNIFSFLAVPYPSQTPIGDPVDCMTNIDGCLFNGLHFEIGDFYCLPLSPIPYQCVEGVMEPFLPVAKKANCPSPFSNTIHGCVLINNTAAPWCEARLNCLKYGSDLVSFENATTRAMLINDIFGMGYSNHLLAGMVGNLTDYHWVTGKPINVTAPIWWDGYPTRAYNPSCGLLLNSNNAFYALLDRPCIVTGAYICEIKIIN